MASDSPKQPSFSTGRRWKIGLDAVLRTALVLAVVVMANYLAAQFFQRFYLSAQTRVQLSSRTVSVLRSMTNHIAVTLYYDRQDDFYPDITSLLDEYQTVDRNITVRTVDYNRDPGEAEKVAEKYKLAGTGAKNLIIFDAGNDHVPNPSWRRAHSKWHKRNFKGQKTGYWPRGVSRRNDIHFDAAGAAEVLPVQGIFFAGPRRTVAYGFDRFRSPAI